MRNPRRLSCSRPATLPARCCRQSFWKLQHAFADPAAAVAADAWDSLVEQLEVVLQVFGAFPQQAEDGEGGAEGSKEGAASEGGVGGGEEMEVEEGGEALREVYFAKFLTSSKLINLQLRDSYFRRHVLVQAATSPHPDPPSARPRTG